MSTKSRRTIYGRSIMGAGALTMRPVVQTMRMTSSGRFSKQIQVGLTDTFSISAQSVQPVLAPSSVDASALSFAVLVLC